LYAAVLKRRKREGIPVLSGPGFSFRSHEGWITINEFMKRRAHVVLPREIPYMPCRLSLSLILGLLVVTAPLSAQPRRDAGEVARYGWLSSLEAGKAQAKQSGKPLMVVLRCVP
jgi:hypothetical protein